MVEPAIFGPIDTVLAPIVEYVVLVLVLGNLSTRYLAYRSHRRQSEDDEPVSRYTPHELSNVLVVLGSFYYLTLHHHSGLVLSVLVVGTVLTDFFEFEARQVEMRQDLPLEAPKGAIFASLFAAAYAAYLAFFFLIEPFWSAIV